MSSPYSHCSVRFLYSTRLWWRSVAVSPCSLRSDAAAQPQRCFCFREYCGLAPLRTENRYQKVLLVAVLTVSGRIPFVGYRHLRRRHLHEVRRTPPHGGAPRLPVNMFLLYSSWTNSFIKHHQFQAQEAPFHLDYNQLVLILLDRFYPQQMDDNRSFEHQ